MEPKLGTKNDEPEENAAERKNVLQDEEAGKSYLQHVSKEKEESHITHSFEWCNGRNRISVTCNKAGTVEDALKRSSQFRGFAEKNKDKELVIVMGGKAITAHCPCSLIIKERLTIKYVKAVRKQKQHGSGSVHSHRKGPSGKLVKFHVLTKGGKNVVKIMKNPALNTVVQEVTVYAYKGEKVKLALRRDGRFRNTIFNKNCVLSHTNTEVNTEMSNLVDDLDVETYKIILLNKSSPPESLPGSLDDAYVMQNESQESDAVENQDPQQSTTDAVNGNAPVKKQKLINTAPEKIPNSEKMQHYLSSQFKHLMERKKTGVSQVSCTQNLLRVEYGKNAQTCTDVKIMKKLMTLSNYVCQVRINGCPVGSGFLLFDKFVLTNAHVLKDIYNENKGKLSEKVTVHFSYESLDQTEAGQVPGAEMLVEEVTGFEYCQDVSGHMFDWVLLRLNAEDKLSGSLLTHFAFPPQSGGIYIIGHPEGSVKKIDSCLVIPSEDRSQVVDNFQYISNRYFEDVSEHRRVLTYGSCFYSGSSGSPVFNTYGGVVAMHSGGFTVPSELGKVHNIIEFGYPLSFIMEHIIVQMVEKKRFDVLKVYLACRYKCHKEMMVNVKKLVESRNLLQFKNAFNNSVTAEDESLKSFFEFFCHKEEPVPMDIDCL